ncbi:MAG TPA: hypothetical protein VFE05_11380 [Longimicrobiaceae bacterium]|nr:hypothetical protein [Longimicrobiaceae bacterium]
MITDARPSRGLLRLALPMAALALFAACSDAGTLPSAPGTPGQPPVSVPASPSFAVLECTASVAARMVRCGAPGTAAGAALDITHTIGGQGQNVLLASSGVAYDSVAEVFSANVTVQNLLVNRLGTPDGTTVTGIKVFFHSSPTATSGSGVISVANADGTGTFTGGGQPYFDYPEILAYQAVSQAHQWRFNVPKTVGTFGFRVLLQTKALPVVVFDRVTGGNRDIWRVALDGSDLVRITSNVADDQNPTVAQGLVVFTSFRDTAADLYRIPLTGGAETRLTQQHVDLLDAAYSSNGLRLAYTNDVSGVSRLYTSKADGTGGAPATTGSGQIEAGPTWKPRADTSSAHLDSIAFVSTLTGGSDIYIATPGGAATLLVGGPNAEVEPAWSPDGTQVAFVSDRTGDTEIFTVNVSTGVVTRLTNRAGTDNGPAWLADGRLVYTAWVGSTPHLEWLDPAAPATTHVIPTGTGAAQRASVVQF